MHDNPKDSRALLVAMFAVRELAARGDHVDEIIVLWQLTRNQSDLGPGLQLAELTRDRFTRQLDPRDIQPVTARPNAALS